MLPAQWDEFRKHVPRWWDLAKIPGPRGLTLYLRLTLRIDANKQGGNK